MLRAKELFEKQYLIPTIWTVLFAIAAFVSGRVWDRIGGPQEVTVRDAVRPTDTLVVRMARDSSGQDRGLAEQLRQLNRQIARLAGAATATPNPEDLPNPNKLLVSRFEFAIGVKGWSQESFSTIARAGCPPNKVSRGQLVTVSFSPLGTVDIRDLSPVFLRVIRTDTTEHVLALEQQYELRAGRNVIVFSAALAPGIYELGYGVYHLADLNKEFPSWYSMRCKLVVDE